MGGGGHRGLRFVNLHIHFFATSDCRKLAAERESLKAKPRAGACKQDGRKGPCRSCPESQELVFMLSFTDLGRVRFSGHAGCQAHGGDAGGPAEHQCVQQDEQ